MGNKILLVEDDQNFGDVLRSYLEMHDYDVTLATDGEAGVEAFKKGSYDLCISDVMMPKKDGFSLGMEMQAHRKDVPFLYLSARTLREDQIKAYRLTVMRSIPRNPLINQVKSLQQPTIFAAPKKQKRCCKKIKNCKL